MSLREICISDVGLKALVKALHANCILKYLDLSFSNLGGDEAAVAFGEALVFNSSLTHLKLRNCFPCTNSICKHHVGYRGRPIGPSGASALATALSGNNTLTFLDLGNHRISDLGAEVFGEALQMNSTPTQLYLDYNAISDLGAKAIGKALQSNQTLTRLSLNLNRICDSGAEALAGALQSPGTEVTFLRLRRNTFNFLVATALAKALQSNRSLTHLRLAGTVVSGTTTQVAEALK